MENKALRRAVGKLQKQLSRTQHDLADKDDLVEIETLVETLANEKKQQEIIKNTLSCPECKDGILNVINIGLAGAPMQFKKCGNCVYKSKLRRVKDEDS